MNKVLIIGLGSIGMRHAKALLSIENVELAALRTRKGNKKIDEEFIKRIKFFTSDNEIKNWEPTHIIISNPTSLHVEYLKKYLNLNVKIFIEKPIADSLNELENIDINLKNIYVGYNLRFHKIILTVKQIIQQQKYGKVLAAELSVGHYLPSWHPYEDYRTGYAARKDLGGGVIRTLSHEIDLAQFFLGKIKTVFAKVNKISSLEIDVDDYTTIICETINNKRALINLNYLNPKVSRVGKIYLEKGILEYVFEENIVKYTDYETSNEKIILKNNTDFNQQYIEQMKEFLSKDKNNLCNFADGINVMKIISASEISNNKKKEICLN